HCTKDVAMIGHCDGRHAQIFDPMDKLFHIASAIEHGVVGMKVQVDELGHELCFRFYVCAILMGKAAEQVCEFFASLRISRRSLRTRRLQILRPLAWRLSLRTVILLVPCQRFKASSISIKSARRSAAKSWLA